MTPESPTTTSTASRRQLLTMAAVGGAGLFAAPAASAAGPPGNGGKPFRISVLGTTDLHGNVYNWNYFANAEYTDRNNNDIGVAKAATLIKAVREERGADRCITLDAGDTIQGTPLAYYYAKVDPITGGSEHPMATAMNAIGYDAAALGNHEYNYGLDVLRAFEDQCDHPLLSANSVDWDSGEPVFTPYVMKTVRLPAGPAKIGILGLVTPGVAIWDKANVEGKVRFPGIVEQARVMVPRMKAEGADVVIVSCHSGPVPSSSYGDALPYPENASRQLAEQVPDIDAVLVGHAHIEVPELKVTNEVTGTEVLLSEPLYWGMRVSVMDLDLVPTGRGGYTVKRAAATLLNANTVEEDAEIAALVRPAHQKVLAYVNSVIGTSTEAMSAATSRYEDTAAMDFINLVQAQAVKAALDGTASASTPVLSIAAPFNKDAAIPEGEVTVRDVAGLYIYDNTLLGITLTGSELKDYLEKSATYFQQVSSTGPFAPVEVTNAVTDTAPNGTPDYNYDIMGGLDAPLTYDIDIAQDPGSRIVGLAYGGVAVSDGDEFVVAINNYRQSGGGGFPHVVDAPVVYNRQVEIRQLLIDWVADNGEIDPPSFFSQDWRLVADGAEVQIQP